MPQIKTILFDFMGTCLDWHTSIVSALPLSIPASTRSALALHWRQTYFNANAARQAANLPPEDIDITHRRTLHEILNSKTSSSSTPSASSSSSSSSSTPSSSSQADFSHCKPAFDADPDAITRCIRAWHTQAAWTDVHSALAGLKARGYEVVVHANGTTRLQMDLARSSGLVFDMLVSSQVMGCYKPAAEAYERVLELVDRRAEEVVLVAAHAYDVRGAKAVGIRGVYVRRWSDDVLEDQDVVRKESDVWIEGMGGLVDAVVRLEG